MKTYMEYCTCQFMCPHHRAVINKYNLSAVSLRWPHFIASPSHYTPIPSCPGYIFLVHDRHTSTCTTAHVQCTTTVLELILLLHPSIRARYAFDKGRDLLTSVTK